MSTFLHMPLNRTEDRWTPGIRLIAIGLFVAQLLLTALVLRPDELKLGQGDTFTYYAAGQRLNAGHHLYGPLVPDDLIVPTYPRTVPAPILSPPLIAVIWRPLALLPGLPVMATWWFLALVVMILLVLGLITFGPRRSLAVIIGVELLGIPLMIIASVPIQLGHQDPISIGTLSGNINVYLVALLITVWWATCRNRPGIAGAAAALAAVLKLGPFLILWWFVTRRAWASARAFIATSLVLVLIGLVFAGLSNNLNFAYLALGGRIRPSPWSVAAIAKLLGNLIHQPHLGQIIGRYSIYLVIGTGFVAIAALRDHPRASYAVTVVTIIFSSPVVLQGNFMLLLALATPWVMPIEVRAAAEPGLTNDGPAIAGARPLGPLPAIESHPQIAD